MLHSPPGAARDRIPISHPPRATPSTSSHIDANVNTGADDAFTFIGAAAYSGTAGELRITTQRHRTAIIHGDVNGDGVDDFQIFVQGVTGLAAGDFVL